MSRKLKNFLRGAGTVLDICPPVENVTIRAAKTSTGEMLTKDVRQVGKDFKSVLERIPKELAGSPPPRKSSKATDTDGGKSSAPGRVTGRVVWCIEQPGIRRRGQQGFVICTNKNSGIIFMGNEIKNEHCFKVVIIPEGGESPPINPDKKERSRSGKLKHA